MNANEITAKQADTKLAAFELTTREEVSRATEIEIHARLVVRTDGLIEAVDETPIKSQIENVVGECITMKPKGEVGKSTR